MNIRDIEIKLNDTMDQLAEAENEMIAAQKKIQVLKKQKSELEKFKKNYLAFEEKFAQYGKKKRNTKVAKKIEIKEQKDTKPEEKNDSLGLATMFNH